MTRKLFLGPPLVAVILAVSTMAIAGQTDKQKALNDGAQQMTSKEIAERFIGKTGIWVSPAEDKKIAIHYSEDNVLSGKLVGGDWSGTGYYGVADDNSICISWDPKDEGRLRCMDVLVVDGVVKKFNADGSLNGSYAKFEEGKNF